MRKILAMVAVLAGVAMAGGPVSCYQVDKYVIKGVPGCRCIILDVETPSDSVFRRNILQYCPVDNGRYWTSLQIKIPHEKWVAYENMDCSLLDAENVSCRSLNQLEDNPDFKYLSLKYEAFLLFLYQTYGIENINYLTGVKRK